MRQTLSYLIFMVLALGVAYASQEPSFAIYGKQAGSANLSHFFSSLPAQFGGGDKAGKGAAK